MWAAPSPPTGVSTPRPSPSVGKATRATVQLITKIPSPKTAALGVPEDVLTAKTAVCEEVARAMAQGALQRSPADVAAAITEVAGRMEIQLDLCSSRSPAADSRHA